ncbi:hyperpolarization activated cyclic nucleotide-gated potassium channel 3 [Pycnococcus provasolii]|uniref:Hyperpolarization activated cyclic nucleotide-gated potassium channel 3 n=1 Tax=Pycnococcus provasolii TaxID=41880 RepID=A0A830H7E3_9CHLO|nr:hyperpolarization activated cyclic nucleotide-gated potassium channel 3 [Pycnococcus provasolii]
MSSSSSIPGIRSRPLSFFQEHDSFDTSNDDGNSATAASSPSPVYEPAPGRSLPPTLAGDSAADGARNEARTNNTNTGGTRDRALTEDDEEMFRALSTAAGKVTTDDTPARNSNDRRGISISASKRRSSSAGSPSAGTAAGSTEGDQKNESMTPTSKPPLERRQSHGSLMRNRSFNANVIGDDTEIIEEEERELVREDFDSPFRYYLYKLNHLPVIDPKSNFRVTWDFIAVILILYTVFSLPFNLGFYWSDEDAQREIKWTFWTILDLFIDIYFMTDVVLNFNTGYIIEKDEITVYERDQITMHYLRTWFVLDFLSSIPIDFVVLGDRASPVYRIPRLLRLFRMSRLLRLMRLGRMIRYVQRFEFFNRMSVNPLRIFKLVSAAIIFCHWNACIQWLVVEAEGFTPDSWAVRDGVAGESNFVCYSHALFRAVSHMLCIGYGATPPLSIAEIWATNVSMVFGASLFASFVGIVATLIMQSDTGSVEYEGRMDELNRFMAYRRLPLELRDKIRHHYQYRWKNYKLITERRVLENLPPALREEVQLQNCSGLIESVPFFEGADKGFISDIVSRLQPFVYLQSEIIIREGQAARCMYFLREGEVAVEAKQILITKLSSGSYFGEIGIVNKVKRTATIRAITVCDTYMLMRSDFEEVMESNGENMQLLERIAKFRLRHLSMNLDQRQKKHNKITTPGDSDTEHDSQHSSAVCLPLLASQSPDKQENEGNDSRAQESGPATASNGSPDESNGKNKRATVVEKLEAAEKMLSIRINKTRGESVTEGDKGQPLPSIQRHRSS